MYIADAQRAARVLGPGRAVRSGGIIDRSKGRAVRNREEGDIIFWEEEDVVFSDKEWGNTLPHFTNSTVLETAGINNDSFDDSSDDEADDRDTETSDVETALPPRRSQRQREPPSRYFRALFRPQGEIFLSGSEWTMCTSISFGKYKKSHALIGREIEELETHLRQVGETLDQVLSVERFRRGDGTLFERPNQCYKLL